MRLLRLTLGGLAIAGAGTISTAHAADIYRPDRGGYKDSPIISPVQSWTGFYIGVNGGYGFNRDSDDIRYFVAGGTQVNRGAGFESDGAFGGGQIGYNWQRDRFVFGIEADIQGGDISDRFNQVSAPGNAIAGLRPQGRQDIDYFGTVRGRIGYAFDQTLVYFTGGFAYGSVDQRVNVLTPGGALAASFRKDDTETGYVLGGGIEQKLTPAWSIKAEYQYIDLGSTRLTGTAPALGGIGTFTNDIDTNFHTVRVGLNYKVGQDYEPLK
jgi:outer membrane immunogenic protein